MSAKALKGDAYIAVLSLVIKYAFKGHFYKGKYRQNL